GATQRRLELFQLRAQGGLPDSQPLGSLGDRAFPRDGEEIIEVVVVQPVHGPGVYLKSHFAASLARESIPTRMAREEVTVFCDTEVIAEKAFSGRIQCEDALTFCFWPRCSTGPWSPGQGASIRTASTGTMPRAPRRGRSPSVSL